MGAACCKRPVKGRLMTAGLVVEADIRVRYAETDALGVAYYANHFVWFEVGRVSFLREMGMDFAASEREGISFVVAEATCRYHAPAHFDERLTVRTWAEEMGQSSITFAYEIVSRDSGRIIATGKTVQVFILMETREPIAIPAALRELFDRTLYGRLDPEAETG
jgi:acyl-CoA thioester hydrolase